MSGRVFRVVKADPSALYMHIAFPRGAACSRCRRTPRFVRLSNTPRTGGMLRDAVVRHEEEEEEEGNSSNFMPRLTFDRFSFAIVERKREKRKKEKEGTTLHYIYIYYIHVAHGPKIKFLRSFFHLGLISSRD